MGAIYSIKKQDVRKNAFSRQQPTGAAASPRGTQHCVAPPASCLPVRWIVRPPPSKKAWESNGASACFGARGSNNNQQCASIGDASDDDGCRQIMMDARRPSSSGTVGHASLWLWLGDLRSIRPWLSCIYGSSQRGRAARSDGGEAS
jgi:hypothetical protein